MNFCKLLGFQEVRRMRKGNKSKQLTNESEQIKKDIANLKEAEANNQPKSIFEAHRLIHSIVDIKNVFKSISDTIHTLTGFDNFIIYLISDDEKHFYPVYTFEPIKNKEDLTVVYGEGLVGLCLKNKEIILSNTGDTLSRINRVPVVKDFRSQIAVPLLAEKGIGALHLLKYAENGYHQDDLSVLQPLSELISSALTNVIWCSQTEIVNQELQKKIEERSRKTEILLDAKKILQSETGWEKGMTTIVQSMIALGFERCGIALVNPLRKTLEYQVGMGAELPPEGTSVLLSDSQYFGVQCVREKRTIHVKEYNPEEGKQITSESNSFVWVPIIFQGEAFAALTADNITTKRVVAAEDVKNLEILAGICAAFIDRTRILIEPIPEKTLETELDHWLHPLEGYIIIEKKSTKAFEIFVDLVTHGIPGFVVSREHPEKIRRRYKLVGTPILWLSRSKVENAITPNDLPKLNHIIRNFTEKSAESIILLDGLEYLITQINFDIVVKFLQELKDLVVLNNSRLIIPLHRVALTDREYSVLEKEFTILKSERDILDFDSVTLPTFKKSK